MKYSWVTLATLAALLFPVSAAGIVVVTTADADGTPCCVGPTNIITNHTYQYSQVEPGRWQQPISWDFEKAFSCSATSGSTIDSGTVTINLMGNQRTLTHTGQGNCPFGLRSFSELWIHNWGLFPLVYSKATSYCAQPCEGLLC